MKKISLTILMAGLVLSLTNCQKQSDEEFIINFAKTACYKMADCAAESMDKMSEEQKKQMMAYMPSHENCDKEIAKEFEKEENKITLTSEEKAIGQECLDEIKGMACQQLQTQKEIASCTKFNSLVEESNKS